MMTGVPACGVLHQLAEAYVSQQCAQGQQAKLWLGFCVAMVLHPHHACVAELY